MSLAPRYLATALIRRSIAMRTLYSRAAEAVSEPGLRSVLEEDAHALNQLIVELQTHMHTRIGESSAHRRLVGAARRRFETLLPGTPRDDDGWIRLLARHETNLVRAFEQAVASSPDELAPILNRLLPRLQAIHLDMNSLAKAVGH